MKAIIFDSTFQPTDELIEFCESIGYNKWQINSRDFDLMFDIRVVEFCEKRLSSLWNEKVYKGKESFKFRCGFAGAGYIRDIDTTKKWIIKSNHVDAPIIEYIDVYTNQYGFTRLLKEIEW